MKVLDELRDGLRAIPAETLALLQQSEAPAPDLSADPDDTPDPFATPPLPEVGDDAGDPFAPRPSPLPEVEPGLTPVAASLPEHDDAPDLFSRPELPSLQTTEEGHTMFSPFLNRPEVATQELDQAPQGEIPEQEDSSPALAGVEREPWREEAEDEAFDGAGGGGGVTERLLERIAEGIDELVEASKERGDNGGGSEASPEAPKQEYRGNWHDLMAPVSRRSGASHSFDERRLPRPGRGE